MSRGIQPLEPIFSLTPKGLKDLHTLAQSKSPGTCIPIVQDHRKRYPLLRVTSSVHSGGILWTERLSAMGRLAALRDRDTVSLMFGPCKAPLLRNWLAGQRGGHVMPQHEAASEHGLVTGCSRCAVA